jgi:hypothetical protein
MTEAEEDYNDKLNLFAGIALPGIIGRMSIFATADVIAKEAFDVAEAMMEESKKREPKSEE